MSFRHGKNTKVWFNGLDLSPYLNAAGMDVSRDLSDITTFGSNGWKEFLSGLLSATFAFEGHYDPTQNTIWGATEGQFGTDNGVLTYCPGGGAAVGDLARLALITGSDYRESSPIGDKVAMAWDVTNEGDLHFGYVLHPLAEDTNTTTGSTRDDGAATTNGWTAHIHCPALDGGSWVVKLEDSANGSAWADVTGGAFTALTAAGYQRLQSLAGATLRRYVRYTATRTGGSVGNGITFALAIARTR